LWKRRSIDWMVLLEMSCETPKEKEAVIIKGSGLFMVSGDKNVR